MRLYAIVYGSTDWYEMFNGLFLEEGKTRRDACKLVWLKVHGNMDGFEKAYANKAKEDGDWFEVKLVK